MVAALVVAVLLALGLLVALIPVIDRAAVLIETADWPRHFSPDAWHQNPDGRTYAAQELVRTKKLLGMPRQQVIALLGQPDVRKSADDFGPQGMSPTEQRRFLGLPENATIPAQYDEYVTGPELGLLAMDVQGLILTYADNRVQSAVIGYPVGWTRQP